MSKIFEKRAADLGIVLSDEMKRQFSKYYEMLVEWNKGDESYGDYRIRRSL